MPSLETLERFIARVEQNAHAEAIEEFYTENASMRESLGAAHVGRDTLAAHERQEDVRPGGRFVLNPPLPICEEAFKAREHYRLNPK